MGREPWSRDLRGLALTGIGVLGAAVLVFSCSPDSGFNTVSDYDVVATHYCPGTDFSALASYVMPDTIMHMRDSGDGGDDLPREHDALILGLVRENLAALGYEEEADPGTERPDVYVVVWATTGQWLTSSTEGWWGMWDWYPHWPPS